MSKVELMQKQRELFHKEPGPELNWFENKRTHTHTHTPIDAHTQRFSANSNA
jgi:hypothetical protein